MGVKDRIQGSRFTAELIERMLRLGWFRVQGSRVYAVPFGFFRPSEFFDTVRQVWNYFGLSVRSVTMVAARVL